MDKKLTEIAMWVLCFALGFCLGAICATVDERSQTTLDYAKEVMSTWPYNNGPYLEEPSK